MMQIPKQIQDWIDKDINLLRNGTSEEIQTYLQHFRNPNRDTEYWHEQAIQKVIEELNL
jgi:hypothetical protein